LRKRIVLPEEQEGQGVGKLLKPNSKIRFAKEKRRLTYRGETRRITILQKKRETKDEPFCKTSGVKRKKERGEQREGELVGGTCGH